MNTPIISIKNVSKFYGEKAALKELSLDVYPGQVIGYIGPNGAGKSTTVKILAGLIPDFQGEVMIAGFDLKKQSLEVKKRIGYVPENAELYEVLTPMEYLDFIGALYGMDKSVISDRAIRLLAAFGIGNNVHERMTTFSKGMKQKVLLVSGIIHDPQIIILDEPLSGLDANAVITVKELIQRFSRDGKTIFYCSHMMDVVEKVSDRILLIDKGEIIADGTMDSLRQHHAGSLEQIFAKLTGREENNEATDAIINAFKDGR